MKFLTTGVLAALLMSAAVPAFAQDVNCQVTGSCTDNSVYQGDVHQGGTVGDTLTNNIGNRFEQDTNTLTNSNDNRSNATGGAASATGGNSSATGNWNDNRDTNNNQSSANQSGTNTNTQTNGGNNVTQTLGGIGGTGGVGQGGVGGSVGDTTVGTGNTVDNSSRNNADNSATNRADNSNTNAGGNVNSSGSGNVTGGSADNSNAGIVGEGGSSSVGDVANNSGNSKNKNKNTNAQGQSQGQTSSNKNKNSQSQSAKSNSTSRGGNSNQSQSASNSGVNNNTQVDARNQSKQTTVVMGNIDPIGGADSQDHCAIVRGGGFGIADGAIAQGSVRWDVNDRACQVNRRAVLIGNLAGNSQAGLLYLAQTDPAACAVAEAMGLIECRKSSARRNMHTPTDNNVAVNRVNTRERGAVATPKPALALVCRVKEGTTRTVVTNWPDQAACARELGLLR